MDEDLSKRPLAVVTGGTGYVGLRLGTQLQKAGFKVRLVDLDAPPGALDGTKPSSVERYEPELPPGAEFVAGSVTEPDKVRSMVKGASIVYHIASYGMSGGEALEAQRIQQVGLGG